MDHYETKKHHEISDKSAKQLLSSALKVLTIVVSGMLAYLLFPAYAYFFLNQRPMPVPILLPFIDYTTDTGYYINIAHQGLFGLIGTTGIIAIELMNCMLKNNVYAAKESTIYSLEVLAGMLKQSPTFTDQAIREFRNVLVKIQDLDRYLIELCEVYYWKFFLHPMLLAYSVSTSLFCYYVVRWTPSFSLI